MCYQGHYIWGFHSDFEFSQYFYNLTWFILFSSSTVSGIIYGSCDRSLVRYLHIPMGSTETFHIWSFLVSHPFSDSTLYWTEFGLKQNLFHQRVSFRIQLNLSTFGSNFWAIHPIFRFSFWLTKLPRKKIVFVIFCRMFSFTKKDSQEEKKLLRNTSVFRNFCQPKWCTKKWDEKLI